MFRRLVKTEDVDVEGRQYQVRYYAARTIHGGRRYSAEVILGPADRVIVDDSSMSNLEARIAHLVPATVYCRMLASQAA
ncbi:MAG TPA: hypothetical protein VIC33_16440 [Vicinamibacterales bacterium]|jgi:hypothetical protein